jgi:hypothetical protein
VSRAATHRSEGQVLKRRGSVMEEAMRPIKLEAIVAWSGK